MNHYRVFAAQGIMLGATLGLLLCTLPAAAQTPATPAVSVLAATDSQLNAADQAKRGFQYLRGIGVDKDFARAEDLFRKAAAQNNTEAMRGLAFMYRSGDGVPRDQVLATQWIQKASELGNPWATADLGYAYHQGLGVPKDDALALRHLLSAAERGAPWGQYQLGTMYRDGQGVPQSISDARHWLRLAAEHNFSDAKDQLGKLPPEPTQAVAPSPAANRYSTAAKPTFVHRRALVIGNDNYLHVNKLANARADAKAVAEELTRVGYQVTLQLDLNEHDLKEALRNFKGQVEGGDEVFFFYAGHGVQLANANYVLPIDIRGEDEEQVKDEAIQLQRVLDDMQDRRAKLTLAVIDACRDNPFKTKGRAIGGRGLAPTTAATGQMIIFSAGTGQQALDRLGDGDHNPNSVFTRTFIQQMETPGLTVDRVLRNVRNQVVELAKSVGHEQVPALYDQVVGDFYFKLP